MSNRSMVKLIHADAFYPPDEVENYKLMVEGLNWTQKSYGLELENVNLIHRDAEITFDKVVGERVTIVPKKSGVFRKPLNNQIHFEDFNTLDEWCFVVALTNTTINFWNHIDDKNNINARSVLDGYKFDYNNLFEWKIHTNILLEPNNGLFFRPWVFHSLESGLVQYYRMKSDKKFRILVMGRPDSSKKKLSIEIEKRLENSTVLHSMRLREKHKDIDFSEGGQLRHAYRMLRAVRNDPHEFIIINMACPYPKIIEILRPDILIWVDDGKKDNSFTFIEPDRFDIKINSMDNSCIDDVIYKISKWRQT